MFLVPIKGIKFEERNPAIQASPNVFIPSFLFLRLYVADLGSQECPAPRSVLLTTRGRVYLAHVAPTKENEAALLFQFPAREHFSRRFASHTLVFMVECG